MILPPPAASKSSQDGLKFGQDGPRSFQDGSKTSPGPPQDDFEELLFASSFLSSIWVRSWSNLGSISHPLGGPKRPPKSNPKTSENHVAARRPPRSLQDGPGPPTGRPKTTPDPPGLPPWGSPGPLQDPYRCPKRLPKGNKNHIIILFCVNNDDYEPDYDDRHDGSEDGDHDRADEDDVSTHGEHKVAVS